MSDTSRHDQLWFFCNLKFKSLYFMKEDSTIFASTCNRKFKSVYFMKEFYNFCIYKEWLESSGISLFLIQFPNDLCDHLIIFPIAEHVDKSTGYCKNPATLYSIIYLCCNLDLQIHTWGQYTHTLVSQFSIVKSKIGDVQPHVWALYCLSSANLFGITTMVYLRSQDKKDTKQGSQK